MMLAQQYPNAFNGIAASTPAISWSQFSLSDYWPQLVIQLLEDKYPHPCELDAITAAAVSSCDGNDGVLDGLISD
jgi:Tannase and feruloyl esterase